MSKAAIELAGVTIPAGERGFGYLHVNTLAARTEVRVPFQVINGAEDGPTLCLESTQHGWEPMGAEVIRRATQRIDPKTLKGTIYCLPLAHPFTVEFGGTIESAGQRVSPADNLDLNQTWPGARENAWLTQQIAYVLWNDVISKCDTILDYHDGTGAADELPVAFAHAFPDDAPYYAGAGIEGLEGKDTNPPINPDAAKKMNEQIMGMAKAFGSPVIWWRQYMLNPKMLTAQCAINGIVPLVVETGGGGMIDATIEPSVTCTMNILKYLGMIEGELDMPERQVMVTNYKVYRSLTGGFYLKEPGRDVGTMVEKGDVLGQVVDPVTSEVLETCTAPVSGMLVSTRVRMPINPGGYIAHLADFDSIIWER
jgi:predicted deacylase